jgi:hypothetical protein
MIAIKNNKALLFCLYFNKIFELNHFNKELKTIELFQNCVNFETFPNLSSYLHKK